MGEKEWQRGLAQVPPLSDAQSEISLNPMSMLLKHRTDIYHVNSCQWKQRRGCEKLSRRRSQKNRLLTLNQSLRVVRVCRYCAKGAAAFICTSKIERSFDIYAQIHFFWCIQNLRSITQQKDYSIFYHDDSEISKETGN